MPQPVSSEDKPQETYHIPSEIDEAYKDEFCEYVADFANRLTQEAMACRIDEKMFIFPSTEFFDVNNHKCGIRTGKIHEQPIPETLTPTDLDRKRAIQAALMRLESINQARELFCNVLHYSYANDIIPSDDWPEKLKSCLVDEPKVIAEDNNFQIIYLKLPQEKLLRTQERLIIKRLLQDNPTMRGLVVVSDLHQTQWHLMNVKYSSDAQNKSSLIIRRIRIGPGEHMRTAVERLSMIDLEILGEAETAQAIQRVHDVAFDVQVLTTEFFRQYRNVFYKVEDAIQGFGQSRNDLEMRHFFAQQLFNRLMFIVFIQKKNGLKSKTVLSI